MHNFLERECRVFTRYLIGMEPDAYVIGKYIDYHRRAGAEPIASFDRALLNAAMAAGVLMWIADSYTAAFRRNAQLRRKLVLVLALLECRPPYSDHLDTPGHLSAVTAILSLAGQGMAFGLGVAASLVIFEPVRLWCAIKAGGGRSA